MFEHYSETQWEQANVYTVYTDIALASQFEITDYINRYGYEQIIFGSDFPFGDTKTELSKIFNLRIPEEKKEMILRSNLERLLSDSNC